MTEVRKIFYGTGELEAVQTPGFSSFKIDVYHQPYFKRSWHYHPEYELLLITSGYGTRLVGDYSGDFRKGDLVLIGGLLPHAWIADPAFHKENSDTYCESIYIQFKKEIFGTHFIDVPELTGVRNILRLSKRGLEISGKNKPLIIDLIMELPQLKPLNQLLHLLKILDLINQSALTFLASKEYIENKFTFQSRRMKLIHEYIMENFKEEISLETCAQKTRMTVTSFCRFFKAHTNQTFSRFLNTVRIDFAGKLLQNTDMSVKEIAYECGFNSVAYFNQQFRHLLKSSPLEFRNKLKV